jgi:predicted NACHT family NTPase
MAGRSLRASATGIQIIRKAIKHNDWKQDELKNELELKTRQPITRLLAGEPIERSTFEELCRLLDLEVKDVAVPETEQPEQPRDIDALVQQVRSRLLPFITAPHSIIGTMRMFSVSQPVPVDKIYIDLNVLEQVSSSRHFSNWRGEYEPGNRQDFDRLSLSQVKQKGVEAISVIKNYAKLLVLGKPGAGKTTFLKSLAVKCIQPEEEFFADLVPLFVALPEFAKMVHKTITLRLNK